MDEILHIPQQEEKAQRLQKRTGQGGELKNMGMLVCFTPVSDTIRTSHLLRGIHVL